MRARAFVFRFLAIILTLFFLMGAGCDCSSDCDRGDDDNGDATPDDDTSDDDTSDDDTSDDDASDDDTSDDDTADQPPACQVEPQDGVYNGPYSPLGVAPLNAVITCVDGDDPDPLIHYTTDGSDPEIGGEDTMTGQSPLSIPIPRTTTLKFFALDQAGNAGTRDEAQYDIYWWDDFEDWPLGTPPGAPWFYISDPWGCVVPTVEDLQTVPGGQILHIQDVNADCVEGDGYVALKFEPEMPWPNPAGFQFDMRMIAGSVAAFGTYAINGLDEPWRVAVFFRNGEIQAFDQSDVPGVGEWITCRTYELEAWYVFDVHYDIPAESYSLTINGEETPCTGLATYFDGVTGDPIGLKFATEGGSDAVFQINNFRLHQP